MSNKQFFISIKGARVEVTEEIYLTYYRSKRRDRYYERDIKTHTAIRNKAGIITGYAPSKEDSLDRLICTGEDFVDQQKSTEDTVMASLMSVALYKALDKLSEADRALIDVLFYQNMTERQAAAVFGLSQKGINKRKAKILMTLRKVLEN